MSEKLTTEQIKDSISELLGKLGVMRVVYVDDLYAGEPPLENVLDAAIGLEEQILSNALPELERPVQPDADIRKARIKELWSDLDTTTRRLRAGSIFASARDDGDTEINDYADASLLAELVPEEMLQTLSPHEWEDRRDLLLEEDAEQPTLFLFDQDMSKGGGEENGGIKIISSILTGDALPNRLCGLLTHTITPENQYSEWENLSEAHQIPRDRFIVIPKQQIGDEPLVFAQGLKYCALSPDFTRLKASTKGILAAATDVAVERVDRISIFDLDQMVFRIAADEGLWEPDMLFRIHGLFHRIESRRLAHSGGELEAIARRLRSVSNIPTGAQFLPPSSTWEIQQAELYEPIEHINENHLPVEMGDIFQKTAAGSDKFFVLLAQPCDLMVRNSGRREPELVHVPVAEIAPETDDSGYVVEMPFFGADPKKGWSVRLKHVHQVRVEILDLCVFNADGSATAWVPSTAPDGLRPSWKNRFVRVLESAESVYKRVALLAGVNKEHKDVRAYKKRVRGQMTAALLDEGLFKGKQISKKGARGITYDCQRISRLSRSRAFGLLMAYTATLGRPAYEREFVKELESKEEE